MGYWELFQDTTDIGHYVEIKIADTWTDHMRHHNALPRIFRFWKIKSNLLLKDSPKPIVSHYMGKSGRIFFFLSCIYLVYLLLEPIEKFLRFLHVNLPSSNSTFLIVFYDYLSLIENLSI